MRRVILLVLLACGWPSRGAATVLADWDLSERLARADRVVIGVVLGLEPAVSEGRVATAAQIAVERTLLGEPAAHLTVTQLGGMDGPTRVAVSGTVPLRRGDRVLLITFRAADGKNYLVGMALGAFLVDGDRLRQRIDVPLARDGRLRPPPGEQTLGVTEVLRAIEAVRP